MLRKILILTIILLAILGCGDKDTITGSDDKDTTFIYSKDTMYIMGDSLFLFDTTLIITRDTAYVMGDTLIIREIITDTTGGEQGERQVASRYVVFGALPVYNEWIMVEAVSNNNIKKILYLSSGEEYRFTNLPSGVYTFNYYTKGHQNTSQTLKVDHSTQETIQLTDVSFSVPNTDNTGAIGFASIGSGKDINIDVIKDDIKVNRLIFPATQDTLIVPLPEGNYSVIFWGDGIQNKTINDIVCGKDTSYHQLSSVIAITSIQGKVVEQGSQNDIENVEVSLNDKVAYSDSVGIFKIMGETTGIICFKKESYLDLCQEVFFTASNVDLQSIELLREAQVFGKISDSQGQPISGVLVNASEEYTTTNINGDFSIYIDKFRDVKITISKEGYIPVDTIVKLSTGSVIGLNINLVSSLTISGTITDNLSSPVASALIIAGENYGYSNNSGNYTIMGIAPNSILKFEIIKEGYTNQSIEINTATINISKDFVLIPSTEQNAFLKGTILDGITGQKLGNHKIVAHDIGTSSFDTVVTDLNGEFVFNIASSSQMYPAHFSFPDVNGSTNWMGYDAVSYPLSFNDTTLLVVKKYPYTFAKINLIDGISKEPVSGATINMNFGVGVSNNDGICLIQKAKYNGVISIAYIIPQRKYYIYYRNMPNGISELGEYEVGGVINLTVEMDKLPVFTLHLYDKDDNSPISSADVRYTILNNEGSVLPDSNGITEIVPPAILNQSYENSICQISISKTGYINQNLSILCPHTGEINTEVYLEKVQN